MVLLRAGSNLNGVTGITYTGNYLAVYFSSNADASVGAGFSAIVRRLYPPTQAAPPNGTQNYGNVALFFDSQSGSLKAGVGNASNNSFGSITLGSYSSGIGPNSVAIGTSSVANGASSIALGGGRAQGSSAVAIGQLAVGSSFNSQAFGNNARAMGQGACALSTNSLASGSYSVAIGNFSRADGNYSLALTNGTTDISGNYATALGYQSFAYKDYSVAIGRSATTNGISAIAIGENSNTTGDYALSLGNGAHAIGPSSIVLGTGTTYGQWSTAIGQNASANSTGSVAIGHNAYSSGIYAVSAGDNVSASGNSSFAAGYNTSATGHHSTAMGCYVSTSGFDGAFTIGDNSTTTVMSTFVDNGFRSRFANGYRLFTNSAATIGAFLNAGANSWAALSDKRLKENFLTVDGERFLHLIASMPQTTWNYIGQDPKTFRHYGPMAQDFFEAFGKDGIGTIGCDTLINQQDFLGVNFIAIQALIKRTEDLSTENSRLREQLAQQKKDTEEKIKDISQHLEALERRMDKPQ